MNNQSNLDAAYEAEWILSLIMVVAGSATILYTVYKVGRDIPLSFRLMLALYLLIYGARLVRAIFSDIKFLTQLRTAITTSTNCLIDICIMFFIFEIAQYR